MEIVYLSLSHLLLFFVRGYQTQTMPVIHLDLEQLWLEYLK